MSLFIAITSAVSDPDVQIFNFFFVSMVKFLQKLAPLKLAHPLYIALCRCGLHQAWSSEETITWYG